MGTEGDQTNMTPGGWIVVTNEKQKSLLQVGDSKIYSKTKSQFDLSTKSYPMCLY